MNLARGFHHIKVLLCLMLLVSFIGPLLSFAGSVSSNWNNDGFLTPTFRADNPTDTEIKNALFGDNNTAYSPLRSTGNTCNTSNINIIQLSGGGILPANFNSNTIYVISTGTYILSADININGYCTALVGTNNNVSFIHTGGTNNYYGSRVL